MLAKFYNPKYIVAWLALIAVAMHSLVPVGYMPDSVHGGLMICDGVHHHMPAEKDSHNSKDDVCPFAAGAIVGFGNITTPVLTPPVYAVLASIVPQAELFTPQAFFSNASPRAPPFFS